MVQKIDQKVWQALSADFIPEYPVNGWTFFLGLFSAFTMPWMIGVNLKLQMNSQNPKIYARNMMQNKKEYNTPTKRKDKIRSSKMRQE